MATFTFKWPHDAEEVYVTGTFDNWTKSEQLEKVGNVFQKNVKIPDGSEKVYYKFVVDGDWKTDHAAPQEKDHEGNLNNVLLPKDMVQPEDAGPAAAILNTVTPESTTTQLAGVVPLENAGPAAAVINTVTPESTTAQLAGAVPPEDKSVEVTAPGGYPETPAADLDKEFKVNPLPAANGAINPIQLAPGEKIPDEVAAGSINDNVTLDKDSYEKSDRLPGPDAIVAAAVAGEISINPLPATDGALNPIKLEPGEKIPDGISAGKITDNVKLDKESYEQSDRLPGSDVAADLEKEVKVNPLPATEGALNPIKLEPGQKIPDEVSAGKITDNVKLDKESYEQSDRLPGSDVAADLEKEVKANPLPATEGALNPIKLAPGEKIPEGVVTGSITDNVTLDKESYEKSDRIPGLETALPPIASNLIPESSLPILGAGDVTINTVTPESTTAALAGKVPIEEPKVPEAVKKSQEEAKVDPEASGISKEVKEKAAVEKELLKVVPEAPPTAEGTAGKGTEKSEGDKTLTETVAAISASAGAAVLGTAVAVMESATTTATDAAAKLRGSVNEVLPAPLQKTSAASELPKAAEVAPEVPAEVKESIQAAGESPEATSNAAAVKEKREVEAELLKEVKEVKPIDEPEASAKAEESKVEEPKVEEAPKAVPVEEPKPEKVNPAPAPAETNGTKAAVPEPAAAAAPAATATETAPESSTTAESAAAAEKEKKKKNRLSAMFSKLKHKISDRK